MYPVSEQFMKTIINPQRNTKINGAITLKDKTVIIITEENIQQGSLYIASQCVDKDDFDLGSVYSSEMGISLITDDDRNTFDDAVIELSFGLDVGNNTYEYVPLGIYNVIEAKRSGYSVTLKALDNMIKLDEDIEGIGTTGTAYDLTTYCCDKCNMTFGMNEKEVAELPNGKEILGVPSDSPIKTCRDLISYISQILGGYACCNRKGELIYKTFTPTVVSDLPPEQRFNTNISDFKVSYNAVSISVGENIFIRKDDKKLDGATLELESNPLLQFASKPAIEKILDNILNSIKNLVYTPFECDYAGNPALDVGDFLTVSGGYVGNENVVMVSSSNWKFRGKQKVKAVGKDPKLKVKETQLQKQINNTTKNTQGTKEVVYHYENAKKVTVKTKDDVIITIPFVAVKDANPLFHADIILNVLTPGTLIFTYMIDNSIYRVKPMYTVNTGYVTISLFLPLIQTKGGLAHQIEVLMKSSNATGYIEKEQIQAVVAGQGLSAEATMWDGTIKVITEIKAINLTNAIKTKFTASQNLYTEIPTKSSLGSSFRAVSFGQGITLDGFTTSFEIPFVLENHTYWFDKDHQADYEYFDTYYFEIGKDYIKVADDYMFEGVKTNIDSGFLQVAQVDSAKFNEIKDIRIEVV